MKKEPFDRRNFLKAGALGIVGFSPLVKGPLSVTPISPQNTGSKKLHILCIGAHPGDPEFGCGGTMAKYSKAGNSVTFLYITRGEAYNANQSYALSADIRTKEAELACKILRAIPLFAGQIDGNTELNNRRNEEMTTLILAQKADIVYTHWPVDSHPDHQVTGLLTLNAWVRSGKKFDLYFYEVNTGSETMAFDPTDYVDITDVRETKKEAMFAHKSQEPQSVYDSFFKTMESFRGLEAGVEAAEAFIRFNAVTITET
jgi:LmbE family N-acetylglucosaminyl deacetylase